MTETNSKSEPWRVKAQTMIHKGVNETPLATIGNFWHWDASDLRENTTRGGFAEYLVALALGVTHKPRIEWAAWDIETDYGIKVEVKATSKIQAWKSTAKTQTTEWNGIGFKDAWIDGKWQGHRKRWANVYVFCLQIADDESTYDATDLSQWMFYVIATEVLNKKIGTQQSIRLNPLKKLGAEETDFAGLNDAIIRAANVNH